MFAKTGMWFFFFAFLFIPFWVMILIRFSMPVAGSIQSIGFRTYSAFTCGGVAPDGGLADGTDGDGDGDGDSADGAVGDEVGISAGVEAVVDAGWGDGRYGGGRPIGTADTPSVGYPVAPSDITLVNGPVVSGSVVWVVESENGSSDKLTLARAPGNCSVGWGRGEDDDEG